MRLFFAVLAGVLAAGLPARADFVLTFDRSNYDVGANGTVKVDVSLTETGTTVLTDNGLIGAGLLVRFNLPATASDPAQVVAIQPNSGVNPGAPDFDFVTKTIVPATVGSAGSAELDWSLTTNTLFPPSGANSILIGSFTFVAGSVIGDVTGLEADLSGLKFIAGDGTDIDDTFGIKSSTATIKVGAQPTPEPSSVTLAILGSLPVVGYVLSARSGRRHEQRQSV
jgi:hypothetical protein